MRSFSMYCPARWLSSRAKAAVEMPVPPTVWSMLRLLAGSFTRSPFGG